MKPVISVIIPVYNREKYIGRCVDSVLSQSFDDFEVLLIDDGSSDLSPQICDEYAKKDARVKVIHKANGGVSSARNEGLKVAQGEYITFVDSDDLMRPGFFEGGNKKIKEYNPDLIVAGFKVTRCGGHNRIREGEQTFDRDRFCTIEEILDGVNVPCFGYMAAPWGKLYKSSIIRENNLCFDTSMRWGEDTYFNYDFLQYVKDVYAIKNISYDYYVGTANSLTCDWHDDSYEIRMKLWRRNFKLLRQLNILPEEIKRENAVFFEAAIGCIRDYCVDSKKDANRGRITLIKKIAKEEHTKKLKFKELNTLPKKSMLLLIRLKCYRLTLFVFDIYFKIRLKNKET